ncbi:ferritin-like domain-containing protein [Bdellovibrio sp. HCB274]|uniref:ferritin-like domain-containing protein n=1 Tax=Bdellovibrio sp. HCB274 TaxID=3394361 RepID=UPI0039B56895
MKSFANTIQELMSEITQDAHVESAWLTAMAHMEHLAAKQILGNISQSTPAEFVEEIRAHAADEYRHRDVITRIRPIQEPASEAERDLRARLCAMTESFTMSYFGNPVLVQANNRFAAYVHGAITIEQFPFQIYSSYIPATSFAHIREAMAEVLSDETAHIQLGKKFRESLTEEDQLSLQQLQAIEKDMCRIMVQRMTELIRIYKNSQKVQNVGTKASTRLAWMLGERPAATLAWVQALGFCESNAAIHMQREFTSRNLPLPSQMPAHVEDEMRHAKLLQRSVLLERRRWLAVPGYKDLEHRLNRKLERYLVRFFSALVRELKDPEMLYLYGAWGLEMRVFKHYSDLVKWTDNVGVAYIVSDILEDEAEHTKMVNATLNEKNLLNPEILKFVRQMEEDIFEQIAAGVIEILAEFDLKPSFTPPYIGAFSCVPSRALAEVGADCAELVEQPALMEL